MYFIPDRVIVLTSAKCESYDDKKVSSLLQRLDKEVEEEKNEGSDHQNQPQALNALDRVVPVCWYIRICQLWYIFFYNPHPLKLKKKKNSITTEKCQINFHSYLPIL